MKTLTFLVVALFCTTLSAQESRFSISYISLGNEFSWLANSQKRLLIELNQRTQIDPDQNLGWKRVDKSLKNASPFLWILVGGKSLISPDFISNLQRYIASGGTIMIEGGTSADSAGKINFLQRALFEKKKAIPLKKDHLITRTFYILKPHSYQGIKIVEDSGRVPWIQLRTPLLKNLSPPLGQEQESSIRSAINIVVYTLTGRYKDDLTHVRYLFRRRKY